MRVSFPFLQWNTIRWNIKISEADFESAKLDFTQAVTSALNEVDTAYFSYANARRSLENTLSKHQKDVRIGEYYQTRYDLGAAELKDYLDALNTADNSMLSALEAKYRVIRYENRSTKRWAGVTNASCRRLAERLHRGTRPPMEKHMFQVKEINKAPFEDAERVFETSHPELRYAVASQRAVGFYESLKDYNENASLWVAWFEGEKPADLAAFIQQEIEKAEASVEE